MEEQEIINALFGLVCTALGWATRIVWVAVRDLQQADTTLAAEMSEIKVLVAGRYMTREEHAKRMDRMQDKQEALFNKLFDKMSHLEAKLDGKADK